ncbi:protein-glutamate O-methyltransferase CheR [Vibrio sp. JC009]|uniref:CheR family methyltransferase n=1 Tax=Vibrio sp. JC009 TaxID=2912314 RepID=UPI0023AFA80F|nr:protein-glutamate O-methyltransferase CheR [Vibrio sp. JC009]WED21442.1 protein-glutamate O-methyltransferase CheR [Vibrio sp. JC009]
MEQTQELTSEQLEIQLLLEAIYRKYDYDFRQYSVAHTRRRLEYRRAIEGMRNYSEMQHRVLYDERFFNRLLLDLSINVTEMFRDPWFYKKVRELVLPHLQTYPYIKVWHAGCSAGQEVYSMGIVLDEEGMENRAQVYATDFNEAILEKAKAGIYPMDLVRQYTANYQAAGGLESLSDYYTADYDNVIMKSSLKDKVLFTPHNLASDGVFGEMHVIFCRNVLIYFNRELQNRVFNLFYDSLVPGGFLCLGSKESMRFADVADKFELVSEREKIYRKKRE